MEKQEYFLNRESDKLYMGHARFYISTSFLYYLFSYFCNLGIFTWFLVGIFVLGKLVLGLLGSARLFRFWSKVDSNEQLYKRLRVQCIEMY